MFEFDDLSEPTQCRRCGRTLNSRGQCPRCTMPWVGALWFAWLSLVSPGTAWLLSIWAAQSMRRGSAQVHLIVAGIEGLLILGALLFGVIALVTGRGKLSVVLPAAVGLLISLGTMVLIGFFILSSIAA